MINGAVGREQRHSRQRRCPICGGAEGDPRGKGVRCTGYTSLDGEWCHCSRGEHAGAIDQNAAGLFAHRMHGSCHCGTSHGEDTRTRDAIEATYGYRDEGGVLLFEVVRFTGKNFRQRRPDRSGGWVWKVGDARRVLYRLPELLDPDNADRVVHIVEGEKDVDTLGRRGFLATTNPGGCAKWHLVADIAKTVLRDRDVIVIADADDVGRKHARDVAASLRGIARSLRVVEAPSPHKDVAICSPLAG